MESWPLILKGKIIMDREVVLRVGDDTCGDDLPLGYVSDFLRPRDDDAILASGVFGKISEAIHEIEMDSESMGPVVITIK